MQGSGATEVDQSCRLTHPRVSQQEDEFIAPAPKQVIYALDTSGPSKILVVRADPPSHIS